MKFELPPRLPAKPTPPPKKQGTEHEDMAPAELIPLRPTFAGIDLASPTAPTKSPPLAKSPGPPQPLAVPVAKARADRPPAQPPPLPAVVQPSPKAPRPTPQRKPPLDYMTMAVGILVASAIGMFIYLMQTPSPKIAAVSPPEATFVPDTSKNTNAVGDKSPSPAELSMQPSPIASAEPSLTPGRRQSYTKANRPPSTNSASPTVGPSDRYFDPAITATTDEFLRGLGARERALITAPTTRAQTPAARRFSYSPSPFQNATPAEPVPTYSTPEPPAVAAPTPLPLTFRVAGLREGESLNLRQGPGSNYRIVLKVPAGSRGITLGSNRFKNGTTLWREVSVGGYTGFVNEDYLEAESTPP